MASVFDVVAYILQKAGPVSHMKLQKLVYYAQAWSLVWDESPLFDEKIEAWANGPVVRELFSHLKGAFKVESIPCGKPGNLTPEQKETVDRVIEFYAKRDAQYLSDLTHMESPWLEARQGMAPGERGDKEITHAALAEYYSSL